MVNISYVVGVEEQLDGEHHEDGVHQHAGEREHADLGQLGLEDMPVQVIGRLEYQDRQEDLQQAVLSLISYRVHRGDPVDRSLQKDRVAVVAVVPQRDADQEQSRRVRHL